MFEGKLNKIIVFFIYVSIFINSYVLFKGPVDFYIGYVIIIVLLPVFIMRYGIPKYLFYIFSFLFLTGMYNIFAGNNTIPLFFKVFTGLFGSYLFYFYVILESDYDIENLFKYYLKGAYIVSIIGLIQFISFLLAFQPGYNFQWILNKWGVAAGGNFGIRINSIYAEPTYYAICISPAVFVAMYDIFSKQPYYFSRRNSLLILVVYLLTFSGIGYVGFLLCIVLFLLNFGLIRYFIIFIPILIMVFYLMYNNVSEFRTRYDGFIHVFTTGTFSVGKTHGTAISTYNNFHIALENFKSNYLFGTGIGSHPIAAEKYSLTKHIAQEGLQQNYLEGNSMLIRIGSETGLFGLIICMFIIFKYYVIRDAEKDSYHWMISNAVLVLILLNLIRQGNYFLNGFPFFVYLYYFNYQLYKKNIE